MSKRAKRAAMAATWVACVFSSTNSFAHHEALFGPQSSLAVESEGFVSLPAHEHVFGAGSTYDQETNCIVSAGVSPFRSVPWSLSLVQSYTYENARAPQGDMTGPLSSCGGCVARENLLLSTSYRFDFEGLKRATGKDGNFALLSGAIEPPTGEKDYAPLHGPVNYILAAMAGVEWSHFAAVGLGYYRVNSIDDMGSKKGNNWLAGLGFAYTAVDETARMVSVQMGLATEVHDADVTNGIDVQGSNPNLGFQTPHRTSDRHRSGRRSVSRTLHAGLLVSMAIRMREAVSRVAAARARCHTRARGRARPAG